MHSPVNFLTKEIALYVHLLCIYFSVLIFFKSYKINHNYQYDSSFSIMAQTSKLKFYKYDHSIFKFKTGGVFDKMF